VSAHVLDLLSMYLDGELAAGARAEVDTHLRGCAACARRLEELAAVDAAARELPVPAPPGYFEALPARVRARLPAPRRKAPPVWVWAAAAGLALAGLAPLILRHAAGPGPDAARTEQEQRLAPPPAAAATEPEAQASAPPARAESDQVAAKDELAVKEVRTPPASSPAATSPPALVRRSAENAAGAPPPPAPQVQKHAGPWAQAPAAAPAPAPQVHASEAAQAARREGRARAEPVQADTASGRPPGEAARLPAVEEAKAGRDQDRSTLTEGVATFAEAPTEDARYRALLARRPASASEDRQLHDAWRAFAASYPTSPRSDEARVRALDALLSAYRRDGEARDRERLREEAALYLQRSDAAQAPRVRAILESIH